MGKPVCHFGNDVISLMCSATTLPAARWAYRKGSGEDLLELATWIGDAVPTLGTHFHDEAQIVFALSGARSFSIRSSTLTVNVGQCAYVPPGMPHRALPTEQAITMCLNAYVSVRDEGLPLTVMDIKESWFRAGAVHLGDLIQAFGKHGSEMGHPPERRQITRPMLRHVFARDECLGDIAKRNGYSREGFSRQFSREVGMAPQAFRIVERLNEARHLLRAGKPIAAVAAQTGFADQSHFGRLFRQIFGTTPAAFCRS